MKSILACLALALAPFAHSAAPKADHITAWTMIRGCPYPKHPKPFVIVLTFSDGSVATFTDDIDPNLYTQIKKALGDMEGRVFQFSCGSSA